ncbi:unnamed protein product [Allacma fusca]|uniref:Lipase n=1 Tax=Allacma fusca TaxID=39272 RepID=A0A8J2K9V4_9HEXA|nr:unnamed protein product [Allacma fusca]
MHWTRSCTIIFLIISYETTITHGLSDFPERLRRVYGTFLPPPPIEAFLNTPELIEHYNYTHENHSVTTDDGYILQLFRIPHGMNNQTGKGPVFIQHGFTCSSDDWLLLDKSDNLPLILADQGYDVWLGNSRGNSYSNKHLRYPETSLKFWDFTFDEMGMYDIPAAFSYILNVTGSEQLNYIGHSMGTMIFFIAMDTHPHLQSKVKRMIAMAPAVYMSNVKNPIRVLTKISSETLLAYTAKFHRGRVVPKTLNRILNIAGPFICFGRTRGAICKNLFFLFSGFNKAQTTVKTASIVAGHTPSSASAKTGAQFIQYIKHSRFQRFDYGQRLNVINYGTQQPPVYNLTNVNVPVMVLWGKNDRIVVSKDIHRTVSELGNVVADVEVQDPLFSHYDFTYAKNAKMEVYDRCLKFLNLGQVP